MRALKEYDRLGPEGFFSAHGFAPTTTYDLVWDERRYPPKAILGTAYEFATGQRLASGDFEGGKSGAVKVLGNLGFTVEPRRPAGQRLSGESRARVAPYVPDSIVLTTEFVLDEGRLWRRYRDAYDPVRADGAVAGPKTGVVLTGPGLAVR
ncbi:MAG TPA: hypothetical protein VNV62_16900, partial [Trebonia sp.]|nr:hypothetical protein [Trebonia sp.]